MRNKLLEKELKEFGNRGYGAIFDAQRMLDFVTHVEESYSLFPEHCFNEPEMVRLAAEKLHSGIERAQELLRILEKHYGVVEKKPRGGSFSCCAPCACECSAPCSPGRPQ